MTLGWQKKFPSWKSLASAAPRDQRPETNVPSSGCAPERSGRPSPSMSRGVQKTAVGSTPSSQHRSCRSSLVGAKTSSEEIIATKGARASARPSFDPALAPTLRSRKTQRSRSSRIPRSTSCVPSVDPSSMTMSSMSCRVCARTLSTAAPT